MISGQCVADDLDALLDLDFDELSGFDVEMETAAKNVQSLNDIPASVYVISNERIVRSGYTSISELLSLVPGFLTTKYSENGSDISSKGFHDSFYNKLLIMVDGRSVYSPVYGGTYMADLDYLIGDIEQIEVVRGPAGTMWGANSANGVVNIITKSAQNTQGTHVSAYAGDYANRSAEVRHGFSFGEYSFAKVFYKYKHSPSTLEDDALIRESHQYGGAYELYADKHTLLVQVGGESSTEGSVEYWYTSEYDPIDDYYYYSESENPSTLNSHSWNLNVRHQFVASSETNFNTSFFVNYDADNDPFAEGDYLHAELDSYMNTELSQTTSLIFGGGIRAVTINFDNHISDYNYEHFLLGQRAAVNDTKHRDYAYNLYGQVEVWLSDKFKLVAGAKAEHFTQNNSTEFSPQLRGLYNVNSHHSIWGGIARAVMLPSYIDSEMDEVNVYDGLPDLYLSDPGLENESVISAELGYRYNPRANIGVDTVVFASQYENLRGVSYMDLGYSDPSRVIESDIYDTSISESYTSYLNSDYDAKTFGAELAINYQPVSNWSLFASYAYLTVNSEWTGEALVGEYTGTVGTYGDNYYDIASQHTATVQSLWSVTEHFDIDLVGRYFNQSLDESVAEYEVDPFAVLDARLAWQKQQNWPSVELIAQNLLGADYSYLNPEVAYYTYINELKWYARLTYDF
jgi:iron complex outermembrane receptor protein